MSPGSHARGKLVAPLAGMVIAALAISAPPAAVERRAPAPEGLRVAKGARPAPDRGPFVTYPAFSPDGAALVCSVDATGDHEIWLHAFIDGSWVRLTENPARDTEPAFSPDGTSIAFVSDRDDNREIYIMNADGSGKTNLTHHPARDSYPSFSPDGRRILFYSDRGGSVDGLYFLDVATREVTPVPGTGPAPNHSAAWSPDGKWIVYDSGRDGRLQLYALDLAAGGERRLTSHDGDDLLPQISPDGSKVLFGSRRDGNEEIYVMDADGSGGVNLTRSPATDLAPRWAPDGTIVYVSDGSGRWSFHFVRADGSATGREPLAFPEALR